MGSMGLPRSHTSPTLCRITGDTVSSGRMGILRYNDWRIRGNVGRPVDNALVKLSSIQRGYCLTI